jgi:hypothetical protein
MLSFLLDFVCACHVSIILRAPLFVCLLALHLCTTRQLVSASVIYRLVSEKKTRPQLVV